MKQLRHICQTCTMVADEIRGRMICAHSAHHNRRGYARTHTCDDWKAGPVCKDDCPGNGFCYGRVKCWAKEGEKDD